ncbi:hypothetical protein GCM10020255_081620 [Rhodococcus baikonurensis]
MLAYCEVVDDRMNAVFKALADPTRRLLLDRLFVVNGQSLGELCDSLDMSRQAVTQHLDALEDANLISTVRQGDPSSTISIPLRSKKFESGGSTNSRYRA